jgi:hypothetical protein
MARDKEMTPASKARFFLYSLVDVLCRRHVVLLPKLSYFSSY